MLFFFCFYFISDIRGWEEGGKSWCGSDRLQKSKHTTDVSLWMWSPSKSFFSFHPCRWSSHWLSPHGGTGGDLCFYVPEPRHTLVNVQLQPTRTHTNNTIRIHWAPISSSLSPDGWIFISPSHIINCPSSAESLWLHIWEGPFGPGWVCWCVIFYIGLYKIDWIE